MNFAKYFMNLARKSIPARGSNLPPSEMQGRRSTRFRCERKRDEGGKRERGKRERKREEGMEDGRIS